MIQPDGWLLWLAEKSKERERDILVGSAQSDWRWHRYPPQVDEPTNERLSKQTRKVSCGQFVRPVL